MVALCLTRAGLAQAESQSETELDLQELSDLSLEELLDVPVVTASGKAEERSLAAANVFVVTREQIERRGYRSLADILKRVPGLYLVYDYVNHSVGVREVTGGYRGGTRIVKIMVDGFPVSFRPDLEAFIGPEFIPIESVERVEVAKGPLSALYGANAFLATVNVITRQPQDREVEVAVRQTIMNGNAGLGSSGLASYAGKDKGLLLAVSADRIDRSGLRIEQTYRFQEQLDDPEYAEASEDDLALPLSAFARFDLRGELLGELRLSGGYQELDTRGEFQLNSVMTHRSRVDLYNRWATLEWRRTFDERLNLRAYVGGSQGGPNRDYQLFLTGNTSAGYKPHFGYRALNGLLEASYDFGPWLGIDVGSDLEVSEEDVLYYSQVYYRADTQRQPFGETELIDPGEPRSHGFVQVGTYLQAHSAPIETLPDFRLTAAARADRIEFGPVTYPVQTSLRGAIAYRFSPLLTVKLIGGRAFQAPSGTLLFAHSGFGNIQNVVGTERLDEPRQLQPQRVTSAEVVASSQVGSFLSLEASAYYQDLTDVIRFNQVGTLIVAKNSGRKVNAGGEFVANLKLGRLKPYVALSASRQISAEVTPDLAGITSFDGSPALYPRLFGYVGFDLEMLEDTLFMNTELRAAGPRGASQANFYQNDSNVYDLPGYEELDVTLSTGDLPLLDRELGTQLQLSARNLLGTRYFEPGFAGVDIPQPGTTLLMQLRQTL